MTDVELVRRVGPSSVVEVLHRAGIRWSGDASIQVVPSGHTVMELRAADECWFLKLPSKDLENWDDPVAAAAHKVRVEAAASTCLHNHGVPAVETVAVELDADNPVGWPYVLTRRVQGQPFSDLAAAGAPGTWTSALNAVGAYLGAVHAITFAMAGPIVAPSGPDGSYPEAPSPVQDPDALRRSALADLDNARRVISRSLAKELEKRFLGIPEETAEDYANPRFVIGGFHPNHPFLVQARGGVRVEACIDMEGASSGSVTDDLVTFAVGVMLRFRPGTAWWEPFFAGYGKEPPFERVRTELLATCSYWLGQDADLEAAYRRLLDAGSWSELFQNP